MSSNHVGNPATFTGTLSLMTGGDSPTAALFRTPLEKLLDNDAYLAQVASDTFAGRIEIATQAEQETGTDTTRAVTPGRQHFHQSAAKFWAHVQVSGGTPSLAASYNVTSITDNSTGSLTVTIANDFSGAFWACAASVELYGAGSRIVQVSSRNTGSVTLFCTNLTPAAADPDAWNVAGYGDQ